MSSSSISTGCGGVVAPSVVTDDMVFDAYSYLEDIPNFEDYLWYLHKQDQPDKFYCKIDNIILSSVWSNDLKYFYKTGDGDHTKFLLLMGKLIPFELSSPVLIKIAVPVNGCFYYFNEISSVPNGKVWVKDHQGTWFQVLNPHRELYQSYFEKMQASITNTIESIPIVDEKRTIEISNAFICDRNWNWVELDPFLSFSLQGVFIHGDVTLRENGEISNRRMSIRIPITDFIFEYFHCLSKLCNHNDSSEQLVKVHWYSATYKVWLIITSIDSKYKSTYDSYLRRASIDHLLHSHGQKIAMFSRPVLPIFIDTLVDKNSQIHFKKQSLGSTDFKTNPAIVLIRIQDKMGSLQGYFPVLDWMVEIGKGKSGLRSFFETGNNVFLRIGYSKDTEASSCFTPDELLHLINKYNSPLSEEGQIWRHVTDFCCFYVNDKEKESRSRHTSNPTINSNLQQNIKGNDCTALDKYFNFEAKFSGHFISALYFSDEKKQKPLLIGKLVPLETSSSKKKDTVSSPLLPLPVIIHINVYSIDFGASKDDENRGLWMTGVTADSWYKLIAPAHPTYQPIAMEDFSLTKELLAFVDLIQDDNAKIGVFEDRHSGKIVIPYTVKDMFHRVQKGKLNLNFLQHNPEFAVSNLNVIVNWDKSKEFHQSIYELREEDYSKWKWSETSAPVSNNAVATNSNNKLNRNSNHYRNSIQDTYEKSNISNNNFQKNEIVANSVMDVDDHHTMLINAKEPSPVNSSTLNGTADKKTILTGTKRSFLNIDTDDSIADVDSSIFTYSTAAASSALTTDTAPSQPPPAQPQEPPQKKIKKKERSLDDEDDIFNNLSPAYQNTSNNANSNAFLCPYCRKLQKHEKCMNIYHEDGKMLHPKGFFLSHPSPASTNSDSTTNNSNNSNLKTSNVSPRSSGSDDQSNTQKLDLCPYCKSLTKMPKCPLSIHPDGEQLKRRIRHLSEDDEGHERRQYEKQHRMLHFPAWNATHHPANMTKATGVALVSSTNAAISAMHGVNSWGKSMNREDYQGRFVEVADNSMTVHNPEIAPNSTTVPIRSILKKTSYLPPSESSLNNTSNSNRDENTTGIVPDMTSTAKNDDTRKQFLQSLQQQRGSLRQALLPSSMQQTNQHAETTSKSATSTLLWQDEHPDYSNTLGYLYLIEKVDLSQIPRYLPTPFNPEELDEENQPIHASTQLGEG